MLREAYGVKRIILKTGKTDLRLGIDRLAAILEMDYGFDPLEEGVLYLFCGNRRDRIKGLLFEGDGYILLTKRLTQGAFQWPRDSDEAREMSRDAYERLMDGYTVESSIRNCRKIDELTEECCNYNTDSGFNLCGAYVSTESEPKKVYNEDLKSICKDLLPDENSLNAESIETA